MNIVYIHIGSELVSYIIDSVYQTILINKYSVKIYVILSDNLIIKFNKLIDTLNLNTLYDIPYFQNIITVVPLSILEMSLMNEASKEYIEYKTLVNRYSLDTFRDSFWISTTCRFFYIKEFIKLFLKGKKNIIHIENDVMLYKKLSELKFNENNKGKIYMVKDSKIRVVPSFLCFQDYESIELLTKFITNVHKKSNFFVNDMDILAKFPNLIELPYEPFYSDFIIYDGACIGQYLGGVDPRNIGAPNTNNCIDAFNNPSRGFVNKDCSFNISENNVYKINKNGILKYYLENSKNEKKEIVNLHIHSKQLYQFSSIFDIQYNDIITGDRIVNLCNYIITTKEIDNFHKSLETKAVKIFLDGELSLPLISCKIFIYTHLLEHFLNLLQQLKEHIKDLFKEQITFTIYTHNSDHEFTEKHYKEFSEISMYTGLQFKFFSQNVNCNLYENVNLLPIGIANKMWPHGSIMDLYKRMSLVYNKNKTKNIYVNISANTYKYRQEVIDKLSKNIVISTNKNFSDYLEELSEHCFSFCVRGNGIDTHRFWESLYLGTIPIIIDNKYTECTNFVQYLNRLDLPFYVIKNDDLSEVDFSKFNKQLYKTMLCKQKIFSNDNLKLQKY